MNFNLWGQRWWRVSRFYLNIQKTKVTEPQNLQKKGKFTEGNYTETRITENKIYRNIILQKGKFTGNENTES